ncbi:hypothetical protein RFI_20328, partial [Reticulomyxa filosa]
MQSIGICKRCHAQAFLNGVDSIIWNTKINDCKHVLVLPPSFATEKEAMYRRCLAELATKCQKYIEKFTKDIQIVNKEFDTIEAKINQHYENAQKALEKRRDDLLDEAKAKRKERQSMLENILDELCKYKKECEAGEDSMWKIIQALSSTKKKKKRSFLHNCK